MKRLQALRLVCVVTVLGASALLGDAGAGKNPAWKSFLSPEAVQELSERSRAVLLKLDAGDKTRRQAETTFLKGYELAGGLQRADAPPLLLASKDALGDLMTLLRTKAKGGEGIAPALQYNGKLKNQNGIEPLIGALAAKKLTPENVGKTSHELEMLADRIAVLGAITYDNLPSKTDKGTPARWQELSLGMRDAALSLAQSAQKKDAEGIEAASKRLETTCTQCHRDFR